MKDWSKEELKAMIKAGQMRKVSLMTYDYLFDFYFFQCQKITHDRFKYLKVSHRMANRNKKDDNGMSKV